MKTLKSEEVNLQTYQSMDEAWASIAEFIDAVYNQKRLHSALEYRPPAEAQPACGFSQVYREQTQLEESVTSAPCKSPDTSIVLSGVSLV